MKNTTVLDTNIILRFLLNDHPKYFQIASAFMQTIKDGDAIAYIPESVLAECDGCLYDRTLSQHTPCLAGKF